MMKFKHTLPIALALCLVCSAAACGKTELPSGGNGILMTDELTWRNADGQNVYTSVRQSNHFFSDKSDAVTYFCNSMYDSYGYLTPANQPYVGIGVGRWPAWYEWIALIRNWSDNGWSKTTWRSYLINCPVSADGYVWSYDIPHWPDLGFTDSHHNYHYDNNFRFITTVWNYVAWENSADILGEADTNTVEPSEGGASAPDVYYHQSEDVSKGMTLRAKLEKAADYVMNDLHGKDGLILIDENANDGLNVGTAESYSSNYWDNVPFGYYDAYENILFYNSLGALGDLYEFLGEVTKAEEYRALAGTVKTKFNETFWNEQTGRYVGTVDKNGVKRDYGITFVNTEAVSAGLAPAERAKSVYDWLDGKRTVAGDTSTGADIYQYIAAPRSNTLDYAAVSENGKFWWHDNNGGQALSGNGAYGYHVENGGAILYTEFYDIMGRIAMGDTASAYSRLETLAREYAKDELNRDPMSPVSGGRDVLGFIGEFPESGLVPVAYLYGLIGVSLAADGLSLSPNIPEGYEYMGVNGLVYGGRSYTLTAYRDGRVKAECADGLNMKLSVRDTANAGTRELVLYDRYDNMISSSAVRAENGVFALDLGNAARGAAYALLQ